MRNMRRRMESRMVKVVSTKMTVLLFNVIVCVFCVKFHDEQEEHEKKSPKSDALV